MAVVGGAREWARLHNAGIPSTQTLTVLPRQLLIVEGFQTLLFPLLIGGSVALLVYYSWPWREGEKERLTRDEILKREVDVARRRKEEEARRREEEEKEKRKKKQQQTGQRAASNPDQGAGSGTPPPQEPDPTPPAEQQPDATGTTAGSQTGKHGNPLAPLRFLLGVVRDTDDLEVAIIAGGITIALVILTLALVGVDWLFPGIGTAIGLVSLLAFFATRARWARAIRARWARSRWARSRWARAIRARWARNLCLCVAMAAPVLGVLVAVILRVSIGYALAIAATTVAIAWVTLGALLSRSRAGVAITLFAAFLLWAGTVSFLGDLGAQNPKLDIAIVMRNDAPTLEGFYLGGAGGDVYIASETRPRTVTLIKQDDVAELSFGAPRPVNPTKSAGVGSGRANSGGTGTRTTTGTVGTTTSHQPSPQPAPTPSAGAEKVVATGNGNLDGVRVELEVMQPQIGKQLMVLNFILTNTSTGDNGRDLVIGNLLDDGKGPEFDTLDGVVVIDVDGGKSHRVAHDIEGNCLCTSQLDQIEIAPGQSAKLFATFARAPFGQTFDLQMNGFESIAIKPSG
jgi:hypothetical protein